MLKNIVLSPFLVGLKRKPLKVLGTFQPRVSEALEWLTEQNRKKGVGISREIKSEQFV